MTGVGYLLNILYKEWEKVMDRYSINMLKVYMDPREPAALEAFQMSWSHLSTQVTLLLEYKHLILWLYHYSINNSNRYWIIKVLMSCFQSDNFPSLPFDCQAFVTFMKKIFPVTVVHSTNLPVSQKWRTLGPLQILAKFAATSPSQLPLPHLALQAAPKIHRKCYL